MLYDGDDRMSRPMFLQVYAIEPSTEKRARAEGLPWPPHRVLGARVYYSKRLVESWFEQQAEVKLDRPARASSDATPITPQVENNTEVTAQ